MSSSIQDEFKVFKDELRKLNIEVQKVVKVGNGSMDFHEVFYKSPRYQEFEKGKYKVPGFYFDISRFYGRILD